MTPEQMLEVRTGAHLAGVMPDIQMMVEKMQRAVVNKAISAMNSSEGLSPERALSYWMEYAAAISLLKKFEQQVKLGTSAAIRSPQTFVIPE